MSPIINIMAMKHTPSLKTFWLSLPLIYLKNLPIIISPFCVHIPLLAKRLLLRASFCPSKGIAPELYAS